MPKAVGVSGVRYNACYKANNLKLTRVSTTECRSVTVIDLGSGDGEEEEEAAVQITQRSILQ